MNGSAVCTRRAVRLVFFLTMALASPGVLAECRLTAHHARLAGVTVSAAQTTFSLDLAGVPVAIVLAPNAATARVDVAAPLQFQAEVQVDALELRLKKAVDLYGGRVRLGRSAAHVRLGVEGDTMRVSLHETFGVDVPRGLAVPCRALGLDAANWFTTPPDPEPESGRRVAIGPGPVPFFERPVSVDPLEIGYAGPFVVRGRRPGWALIEASWADGSRLKGWVLEKDAQAEVVPWRGRGELFGSGRDCCVATDEPPFTQMTIRRGAPIAASAAGVVWAHAATNVVVEAFPREAADGDWIAIATTRALPTGSCSRHQHMWVQAGDVMKSASTASVY